MTELQLVQADMVIYKLRINKMIDEGKDFNSYAFKYVDEINAMFKKFQGQELVFTFAHVVNLLESGYAVARKDWIDKEQFVYYVPDAKYPAMTDIAKAISDVDGNVSYGAYLALKTAQGEVITWEPSIDDIMSDDWVAIKVNPYKVITDVYEF